MCKKGISKPFKHSHCAFKFIRATVFGFDAARTFHCIRVFMCDALTVRLEPEAEFLEVIGTKVFRVVLLAIHSHLYYRILFHPSPPPHPRAKVA
jgi:hypothetical protein